MSILPASYAPYNRHIYIRQEPQFLLNRILNQWERVAGPYSACISGECFTQSCNVDFRVREGCLIAVASTLGKMHIVPETHILNGLDPALSGACFMNYVLTYETMDRSTLVYNIMKNTLYIFPAMTSHDGICRWKALHP